MAEAKLLASRQFPFRLRRGTPGAESDYNNWGVFEGGAGGNFLQKVSPGMPSNASQVLKPFLVRFNEDPSRSPVRVLNLQGEAVDFARPCRHIEEVDPFHDKDASG